MRKHVPSPRRTPEEENERNNQRLSWISYGLFFATMLFRFIYSRTLSENQDNVLWVTEWASLAIGALLEFGVLDRKKK